MKAAIIASLSFGGAVSSGVPCQTDEDCSLNGVCTSHECVCDPGWTTLPFGVNGAMEPGCGYLDLGRAAVTACGPACAFHGGEGGVDLETTSWGGSVNKDPASGKFVMFAAEMAQKCTLGQWTTNSQVVMATSTTPTGPFAREGIAIPPWSHNPEAVLAPDGTWVIYTLGPGFHEKKEVNCSHGVPPAEVEVVGAPSTRPAGDFISVNFTIHTSKSTKGPWTATTMVVDHWNSSWTLQNPGNWNPAPVIDADDGSVRVMAHTDWSGWAGEVILEAPSWKGPYTVNGRDDLIDHCAFCEEDPFMWQDKRGNWHVLYHRMFDAAGEFSFIYRYSLRESCSQFDSLPLTSLTPQGHSTRTGESGSRRRRIRAARCLPRVGPAATPSPRTASRGASGRAATTRRFRSTTGARSR